MCGKTFFTITTPPHHYFSTLLSFSLKLAAEGAVRSSFTRQMGKVFIFFFVIGVNNMISLILILTLYFFNLSSKYSNCICPRFPVHNFIKHKIFVGKTSVTFLGRACVHDIQRDAVLRGKSITEMNVEIVGCLN